MVSNLLVKMQIIHQHSGNDTFIFLFWGKNNAFILISSMNQLSLEKNLLTDGMIWGGLSRTNLLKAFSLYLYPSSKFSSTPAVRFSFVSLTSGLVHTFLTSCVTQRPTTTPMAPNNGYAYTPNTQHNTNTY